MWNITGKVSVINDFRSKDVKFGGQGAPLVPIGDRLLFGEYGACVNLGGFMNISMEHNGNRIAMDVCPFNIVMNEWANLEGKDYDEGGKMAASGILNHELMDELNAIPFYHGFKARSLGREWVEEVIRPKIKSDMPIIDLLHTWIRHSVHQLKRLSDEFNVQGPILMTGGGAYNDFFISELKKSVNNEIVIPSNDLINFKEALIFAFLGVLNLREEINTLKSVTGAREDSIGGVLHQP